MNFYSRKVISLLFVCISGLIISACAINPVTGKKELSFMGEQQEIQLGASYDPQVIQEFGLYQEDALQRFIDEKGQAMARISHRPNLNWTFRIVDSPMINAFAVPGGYVYFTRGIMAHFNNEAEFAGVLGHEIGHVTARHAARQQTQQTLGQALLIGGMIASKEVREYADVAAQGMGLLFLKFGRDDESQSDELGVQYSTEIGYDAREMADFFYTLKRVNDLQGSRDVPTFLATHPDPIDRYHKVDEMAKLWQFRFGGSEYAVNRDSYLRMIDGIIYGNDPRQGFVERSVFYHPELKFQYPVPNGWKIQNSTSQVLMAPGDGNALLILQISPENTLDAAASSFVREHQLQQMDARRTTVNGNQAILMINDQVTTDQNSGRQQVLRIQSYFIQYRGMVYMIHGLSSGEQFYRYQNIFSATQEGFRELRDPAKLNIKPERVHVVQVEQPGTLSQQFSRFRMPSNRYEELAVLNGMQLDDQIPRGELIKIIGT